MSCPSPEYCAMNGCSANGCARYTAPRYAPRPSWRTLALGITCLAAGPLAGLAVLVALWVML